MALREGRVADAVAEADIALRLADRAGERTPAEWFAAGTLIQALLARGDVRGAVAVCADRQYARPEPDALIIPVPGAVYGALQLATGRVAEAIATLRRVGRWLDRAQMSNPSWCPWRFDLAQALHRPSRDEADELAHEGWRQADRFGCPSVRGRAMRTVATGLPPQAAVDHLSAAVEILTSAPDRYEYATALTALGTTLARTGRLEDARIRLTEAIHVADECGALSLRREVARRLARAGASTVDPPPARLRLHPRQWRAVQLAADGRSDADIAYAMVLDLDTVNELLTDACSRLGASTRADLALSVE